MVPSEPSFPRRPLPNIVHRLGLAAALALSAPSAIWAADETEDDTDAITETTITVSAPRLEGVPQERTTGADTTVTAQEIEDQQIRRLDDALTLVPGLSLSGQRSVGQPQAITIRGLGPRNTRVFIDGIEVSDTSRANAQYLTDDLTMSDVERIEVLRGARPGRFGADNGGGVINITTKRATGPLSGHVDAEYGGYNTTRLSGAVGGQQGPVDLRLSASGTYSDGFSDFNKNRGGREEDPYSAFSVGGRLGLQATDNLRFDLVGRFLQERFEWDYATGDVDGADRQTKRFVRAAATLEMLDDTLIHTLGISDTLSTRDFDGAGRGTDSYDGAKTRVDYVASWAVMKGISVEVGGDATNERIDLYTPSGGNALAPSNNEEFWKGGGFVTLGVTPLDGLDLSASLRGDVHDTYGSDLTYRLGAAYTVAQTGTTLRGSYATAWQTPSLYERFDPCYGNADLEAESSSSWDIGLDQRLWDERVQGHVTYFETSTQDQIAWRGGPANRPGCYGGGYVNIDEAFVQGVEVALTARPLPDVDVALSYTWQNAIDNQTEKRLDNIPVNQGTASVTWRFVPEGRANVGLRYRDRTTGFNGKSDAFWTADIRLAYDILETVTLHGRVENLFDADYEEVAAYGTPGRAVYAGLTVRF